MLKIALTGGPCAGKTSIKNFLTQLLEDRGYKVVFVDEAASTLILSGIIPGDNISMVEFQNFVLDEQLNKENLYAKVANYYDSNKLIFFYDRGLCDQMAYINKDKFEEMLKQRGLTLTDAMNRYDAVLHLVTTADGAEEFYQWNDPSKDGTGNNAARSESPEEAREKDKNTLNAWIGHPHLRVFDNATDFKSKTDKVVAEVFSLLGEPLPKEIERRYLIKKPTNEELKKLGCISETNIIQTYLKTDNNVERRVRQRGTKEDGYSFYYTEKTYANIGERFEKEKRISQREYIEYLAEADTTLHQIFKTRYCFVYDKRYFELDVYPFSDEYAILEIELNDINEDISLPPLTFVKDVTQNDNYKNHSLAETLTLGENL